MGHFIAVHPKYSGIRSGTVRPKDQANESGPSSKNQWLDDVNGDGLAHEKASISHGYVIHIGLSETAGSEQNVTLVKTIDP